MSWTWTVVGERIGLVTLMDYDLGDFENETCRLEPLANPFGPKALPMVKWIDRDNLPDRGG